MGGWGGDNNDMVDRKLFVQRAKTAVNTSVLGMIAKGSDMNVNLTIFFIILIIIILIIIIIIISPSN